MRVAIVGAGAMGTLLGHGFCKGGHDVSILDLPNRTTQLRLTGKLVVIGEDGAESAVRPSLITSDYREAGVHDVVGRKKNVIKRGGITVYPEDVRRIVVGMPGVVEAEVIGLPNAMFEEIIVVCAVVQEGVDADDIRALCRRELAPERRPDRVELLDELPRGPSGKVQRDALISELEWNKPHFTSGDGSLRSRVFDLATEIFACDLADLDDASSPDTLGNWDSYAGMEFVIALEQEFDFRLGAEDIMSIRNIGNALEVVSAATRKS